MLKPWPTSSFQPPPSQFRVRKRVLGVAEKGAPSQKICYHTRKGTSPTFFIPYNLELQMLNS